ncbi:MAG TPA: hypothetical protein QGF95_00780 [Candidatus Latescibacteria bacterium]|jgi:hypothetical protein|nr:hypothetical protein [Gemmatimonadaceae bacterium]HJP29066.1 hypothetical protein [Candidatus Latescibacterota bacterium]
MNSILKIVAALAIFVLVVLAGGFIWVKSTVDAKLAGRIEVHAVAFAVPYPLSQAERDELLRT